MKIRIHNFGRLTVADIKLDGITIIAGPNASGKSTISRVLKTWNSYLHRIDDRIAEERIKSITEGVGKILLDANLPVLFRSLNDSLGKLHKLLRDDFWHNREEVKKWVFSFLKPNDLRMRVDCGRDISDVVDGLYMSILEVVEKNSEIPDELYEKFIADLSFNRAFDGQVGTFFDIQAESSVSIEIDGGMKCEVKFKGGKCVSLKKKHSNHLFPMFYIEPKHLIDSCAELSYPRSISNRGLESRFSYGDDLEWIRILYSNPNMAHWSMQRMQQQEVLNKDLDEIVATIHGEIEKEERVIRFRDDDSGGMISISNIASGVKSMAVLIRGLRNGVIEPGSLLIIDEPETNLHPEWQVKFAKFLVLLNAKFDIRLLINTHSPYFLKAIQVYSDLLEIEEKCDYYMMALDGEDGRFRTKDVSNDIEEVFAEMSRPYARLIYGEKYDD